MRLLNELSLSVFFLLGRSTFAFPGGESGEMEIDGSMDRFIDSFRVLPSECAKTLLFP